MAAGTLVAESRAAQEPPPPNYEAFIAAIQEHYEELSRTYQLIGRFLTQNPNDVAILSINGISGRCGVHASSLVRFAQHFGYSGFKELQGIFQTRLATAAPGFEARVSALKAELELHKQGGSRGFLGDLVARDITSLQDLLQRSSEQDLTQAVDLLAGANTIYIIGQLRSAPIAAFVRYVLTMLRRRVVLLDPAGGLATEMAKIITPDDMLLAISFRFYAKEVINIAEAAHGRGVPILAISDSRLSPLAKTATVLFPIPEDEYTFSRSLAAPMCLAQALMVALAAKLQAKEHDQPHIPIATQPS
jgi:DNA-binding MurR/RpiR family transcriptional regulator